jgi:hypothetical protein
MKPPIPPEILSSLQSWDFWATTLYVVFIVLALAGTVCSIVVALFADKLPAITTRVLAGCAAISLGLIAAFNLGDRSNQLRRSWRALNAAIIEYRADDKYPFSELMKVYRVSGDIASTVDFNSPKKEGP